MKFGKRQIILGALILALGSAVYLNWQFTEALPAAKPTAGEVEADPAGTSKIEDENLGIAQLVNNSYVEVESVSDEIETGAPAVSDAMTDARLSRQTARDEAIDLLDDVLKDVDADSDAKQTAVDESAKIAQNMLKESTAENLIKAKGINDVVVFINGDECNVIVKELGDNSIIIQEIVTQQTGFALDNVHIIEAK